MTRPCSRDLRRRGPWPRFFRERAVPLLESRPAMRLTVGWPMAHSPSEFMMTTTWSDLEALQGFAGEDWASAVIDPAEAHLLPEVHVHHYEG